MVYGEVFAQVLPPARLLACSSRLSVTGTPAIHVRHAGCTLKHKTCVEHAHARA
jgi:hypothetical protein